MMKINFYIFLVICMVSVSLAKLDDASYCYELTWAASTSSANPENYNCSIFPNNPCIEPPIVSEKLPNLIEYWQNATEINKTGLCVITSGNVCIKYTMLYNNDIVYATMFCGKITEDDHVPVTSGCYEQQKNGYVLETCACRSRKGKEPCNMSMQTTHSNILIITILLLTFMKFIY